MGKNSLFLLVLSAFLLIASGAHAATEENKKLASIDGECLYQFVSEITSEVFAERCNPKMTAYNKENDEFYWIDEYANNPDDERQIYFREVGYYKDIKIYSVQRHDARVVSYLFIKRTQRDALINMQSSAKEVLQLVGSLGSGIGCHAMSIDDDWKGSRHMHVTYGYILPDLLMKFLPENEYKSVEQDFSTLNDNSDCFANDEFVIDLETLGVEFKGYYIFSEPSGDIKPLYDSSAIPCLKKQLASLKQEKLADVLLPADKAKAVVQRVVRACKKAE